MTWSLTNFVNSADVIFSTATPRSARRLATSGRDTTSATAAFTLSTTSLGVPAGAEMPRKFSASSLG
ncbi:hypothetical protein Y695_03373 [Hydrogenophaga sp. T4]|nr:hypothetical protein Y695_03373 [Hydrogenophaga sp. T4]